MTPKEIIRRLKEVQSRPGTLGATLVRGVAGTASIKAGHAAIVFFTSIILARSLGPAGYGIVSYVIALAQMLSMPSELGIPNLAVREVAVSNVRKEWGRMRGFIRWAQTTIAIVSLAVAVLGGSALLIWGDRLDPPKLAGMWLGIALVPLISFNALRGAMLRGLRKVLLGQLPEQIIRPSVMLLLLLVLPLLGYAFDSPFSALAAHIASVAVAFTCGLILFYRNRPAELTNAVAESNAASWFRSSIPFGLTALMQLINGRTDILMLGFFRSDAEVGFYRVAAQLAVFVVFGLQIINSIQGPHIAHLYAQGDMKRLQLMVTRSAQFVFAIGLGAVLIIVVFGRTMIELLYRPEYLAAYAPLVIICIGQLVNAAAGSVASLLNMTGHERDTTRSVFYGAAVNVALNLLLTPQFGMIGAACATSATLIVWNLIMWHKVRKLIGINPSPFLGLFRRA